MSDEAHRADPEVVRLLTEMRDLMKEAADRQAEAVSLVRAQQELVRAQQERAAGALNLVRRGTPVVLGLIVIVLLLIFWLLMRYLR